MPIILKRLALGLMVTSAVMSALWSANDSILILGILAIAAASAALGCLIANYSKLVTVTQKPRLAAKSSLISLLFLSVPLATCCARSECSPGAYLHDLVYWTAFSSGLDAVCAQLLGSGPLSRLVKPRSESGVEHV